MLMRSRRIQWNGCRVHDAASGLWSGSSITGEPRRAGSADDEVLEMDVHEYVKKKYNDYHIVYICNTYNDMVERLDGYIYGIMDKDGKVVRFGFRNGYIGPVKTMLLQDVTLDSKIVSDHLWFDLTKGFSGADLSPGDVVEFCARVSAYEKGYKGHKDDVLNRPIERDYRLSRPTKIKKIGKKLILKDEGK